MKFSERLRMLLRLWKYRLREERESIAFMRRQPLAGRMVLDIGATAGAARPQGHGSTVVRTGEGVKSGRSRVPSQDHGVVPLVPEP